MQITPDVLLYFMEKSNRAEKYTAEILSRPRHMRHIRGVQYLVAELKQFKHGFLYVCTLTELKQARPYLREDMIALVVNDDSPIKNQMGQTATTRGELIIGNNDTQNSEFPAGLAQSSLPPCGIIRLCTKHSSQQILNQLLEIYYHLIEWDKNMHIAALEGKSVQDLIDLSEHLIGRPMIAFDGSFDVLGYTKNIPCANHSFQETVRHGYTEPDTMKKLKKKQIFTKIQSDPVLVAPAADEEGGFNIYMQFFSGQTLLGYTNVFCGDAYPQQGYLDLVRLFFENMSFCFRRDYENSRFGRVMYDTFFSNLIQSENINREQLEQQAALIDGLCADDSYQLGIFHFSKQEDVPLPFLARMIRQQFSDIRPFLYENTLCILKSRQKSGHPCEESFLNAHECGLLNTLLENYAYTLGISRPFDDLMTMKDAWLQANAALSFANTNMKRHNRKTNQKYFYYKDIMYHHLFRTMEQTMNAESLQSPFYKSVAAYDANHHTDYRNMLMLYLKNDCNATRTASELGVHRNTVRNMIRFLEEHFEKDLSQTDWKEEFIFSDRVRKYMEYNCASRTIVPA